MDQHDYQLVGLHKILLYMFWDNNIHKFINNYYLSTSLLNYLRIVLLLDNWQLYNIFSKT